MRSFFSLDGPLMTFMGRLADLILLNIMFVLTSLPLFTIGASLSAMFSLTLRMVRDEESYIVRRYLQAFKENFKQATLLWLLVVSFAGFFYVDCRMAVSLGVSEQIAVRIVFRGVCVILFMIASYLFPLVARFENTTLRMLTNAILMMVAHLPSTLVILAVSLGSVFLTMYSQTTLAYGILFWILLGFALVACLDSLLLRKIFDRYSPAEEEPEEPVFEEEA